MSALAMGRFHCPSRAVIPFVSNKSANSVSCVNSGRVVRENFGKAKLAEKPEQKPRRSVKSESERARAKQPSASCREKVILHSIASRELKNPPSVRVRVWWVWSFSACQTWKVKVCVSRKTHTLGKEKSRVPASECPCATSASKVLEDSNKFRNKSS